MQATSEVVGGWYAVVCERGLTLAETNLVSSRAADGQLTGSS